MSKHKTKREASVFDRPDYEKLKAFNDELLNKDSHLGKIISAESVRQKSEKIRQAITLTIVNGEKE